MRRRTLFLLPLLASLPFGCSSNDNNDGNNNPGTPAEAAVEYVSGSIGLLLPGAGRLDGFLPFFGDVEVPGGEGIQFVPDLSPGAPANSYQFSLGLDGDGNGISGTTVTGRAELSGDPSSADVGFGGHLEIMAEHATGLGHFTGQFNFELVAGGTELSGTGTLSDEMSGKLTTITIPAESPILIKPATGEADAMPNFCAYSVGGQADLGVETAAGSLDMTLDMASNRSDIRVRNAVFTPGGGEAADVPDSDFRVDCGGGSINDWVGAWNFNWSCLPTEHGTSLITITRTGSTTIHIRDEDPPGSGEVEEYSATMLPGQPHTVRGYFISGDESSPYREDFTWSLSANGMLFTQVSKYHSTPGASFAYGGYCGAQASRIP